jgi:hypothetical protein
MALAGVDTMWFLPSALNVNVKKFKQARVNGGSNYDSLKDSHCPYLLSSETTAKGTGLETLAGKEDPVELDSSLALWGGIEGAE